MCYEFILWAYDMDVTKVHGLCMSNLNIYEHSWLSSIFHSSSSLWSCHSTISPGLFSSIYGLRRWQCHRLIVVLEVRHAFLTSPQPLRQSLVYHFPLLYFLHDCLVFRRVWASHSVWVSAVTRLTALTSLTASKCSWRTLKPRVSSSSARLEATPKS